MRSNKEHKKLLKQTLDTYTIYDILKVLSKRNGELHPKSKKLLDNTINDIEYRIYLETDHHRLFLKKLAIQDNETMKNMLNEQNISFPEIQSNNILKQNEQMMELIKYHNILIPYNSCLNHDSDGNLIDN